MKSSCDYFFFHCQFPIPSISTAHEAIYWQINPSQKTPAKGCASQNKLHNTYPSYNATAPDRFQGARQAKYPPVPFSELYHFAVKVLQANTVAPLDRRKTVIKNCNQLQTVDNP